MRRVLAWSVLVVALAAGAFFALQRTDGPRIAPGDPTRGAGAGDAGLPAAASADATEATRATHESDAPPAAADVANGHRIRGTVRFAADARPAAGARVRAHRGEAPLAATSTTDGLSKARGGHRAPAAEHDISDLTSMPIADAGEDDVPEGPRAARTALAETIAADDGSFELVVPAPGRVTLEAVAPLATCARRHPLPVVPDGATEGVMLELIDGADVRGSVVAPDGTPVAGARVIASTAFDPFQVFASTGMVVREPAEAATDAAGGFAFAGLEPGLELTLIAQAEGFAASEPRRVATVAGATAQAALTLRQGARVAVRVRCDPPAELGGVVCRLERTDLRLDQLSAGDAAMPRLRRALDAAGQVEFTGIAPGRYAVRVDRAPWLEARHDLAVDAPGQTLDVELLLRPGRSLRGRVAARDGTPIEGARVVAKEPLSIANAMRASTGAGSRSTRSGPDGAFEIAGLQDVALEVHARAPGYDEGRTDVPAGRLDAPIEIALATRGAIEGIVLSRVTNRPLPGFEIEIERKRDESPSMFDPSAFVDMVRLALPFSTEQGKFRIVGVPPGELRLTIRAPGHGAWQSAWLTVEDGATRRGIIASLLAEAVVQGRVVAAADGGPVAGARLRRRDSDGGMMQQMLARFMQGADATTDADGRFRVGGLGPGTHRMVVQRDGFVETETPPVTLAAGESSAELRIELEAGAVIWGEVRGPEGGPVAGASILCQDLARLSMQSAKSGPDGAYRFEGLAPGNFALTRMPAEFALGGDDFLKEMQSQIETHSVRLTAGQELRVDFGGAAVRGSATLVGQVRSGRGAVAGAMVQVFAAGTEQQGGIAATTTEADGSFRFDSLHAGRAFVQVNPGDLAAGQLNVAMRPVLLRDGAVTEVVIELPAGALAGRIVDAADGAPLAGIAVYLATADDGAQGNAFELAMRRTLAVRSGADGRFELPYAPAGPCRIVAGAGDLLSGGGKREHAVTSFAVVAPASGTHDVGELRLPRAARITGTLVDAAGKPLAGGSVFLRDATSGAWLEEWSSTASDAAGEFEYAGVPEGSWDVVARAPGHAAAVARGVPARIGQVSRVRVELAGGTEVFALIGEVDFEDLLTLSLTVEGPQGAIPLTLFGMSELTEALGQPWQPDVVRLGRFGPGTYTVRGTLRGAPFERSITLAGEPELRIPLSLD